MQSLVQLFNEKEKYNLSNKLKGSKTLNEVVNYIQEEFNQRLDLEGEFFSGLNPIEAKVILSIYGMLKEQNELFSKSLKFATITEENINSKDEKNDEKGIITSTVITVSSTIGALFGSIIGATVGAGVGCALGGGAASAFNIFSRKRNKKDRKTEKLSLDTEIFIRIDVDYILKGIQNNYERIDKILELVTEVQSKCEKKPNIKDFPILIEWIQKMLSRRFLGINEDLDYIIEEESPSVLKVYGLEIHSIPEEDRDLNKILSCDWISFYNVQTSDRVEKLTIDLPAVFKDGKIVAMGRIRIPLKNKQEQKPEGI